MCHSPSGARRTSEDVRYAMLRRASTRRTSEDVRYAMLRRASTRRTFPLHLLNTGR